MTASAEPPSPAAPAAPDRPDGSEPSRRIAPDSPDSSESGPRRGLVLGAGGVLGISWMLGALVALEASDGWDPRTADVLLGTSAGSVIAAFLGSGVSVATLANHPRGIEVEEGLNLRWDYEAHSVRPPLPRPVVGSPALVRSALRTSGRRPPMTAVYGLLPRGRASLQPLADVVQTVAPSPGWASHPATWIVAMNYRTGERVPFGHPAAPRTSLSQAVVASCSIPGWYEPVPIDGELYIDGGAYSATSLDLLVDAGLDEVVVLAPMASFAYDAPASVAARLERRWRRRLSRRLLAAAERVSAAGTAVTLLGPGPEDLTTIGANLMDSRRRAEVFETSVRTTAAALTEPADAAVRTKPV